MQLIDDPRLIAEYIKLHSLGSAWPEITDGMKEVGIIDMEIYLYGTTLFMIMETKEDFDHDKAMTKLASLPRQKEWETTVSLYQKTSQESSAKEKWILMERIYKLCQNKEYNAEEGYCEEIK